MAEVSLVHFDGANGSTTITDAYARAWVANGAANLSTATPRIGTARGESTALHNPANYFSTVDGLADFGMGTGDFFLQMKLGTVTGAATWYIPLEFSLASGYVLQFYSDGLEMRCDSVLGDFGGPAAAFPDGALHEIAIGRASGTVRMWFDGVIITSFSNSASMATPTRVRIGSGSDGNGRSIFVDEFRVFKGNCPFTANYTPSTLPYPDPSSGTSLTPGAGSIVLSGPVPTVARTANQALSPAQDAVALTGFAPTLARTANQTLSPAQDSIVLTGRAPTVAQSSGVTLTPAADAIVLTGPVPTLTRTANVSLVPAADAVVLTGLAPVVVQASGSLTLTPGADAVEIVGLAPTLAQTGQQSTLGSGGAPLAYFPSSSSVKEEKRKQRAAAWAAEQDRITERLRKKVVRWQDAAPEPEPQAPKPAEPDPIDTSRALARAERIKAEVALEVQAARPRRGEQAQDIEARTRRRRREEQAIAHALLELLD